MRKNRAPMKPWKIASAAVALACGASLAAAPIAVGYPSTWGSVQTPNWSWTDVTDNGVGVSDAHAYYTDFYGTGLRAYGWAGDPFDTLFSEYGVAESTSQFVYNGATVNMDFQSLGLPNYESDAVVSQGRQQLSFDLGDGASADFDVYITLAIEGSFARWTFEIEPGQDAEIDELEWAIFGDLGSDDEGTRVTPVGTNAFVSHQDPTVRYGLDPVIGWYLDAADAELWIYEEPEEEPDPPVDFWGGNVILSGTGEFELTVGLVDYDPCSIDLARAYLEDAVLSFPSTFGDTLPSFYTVNCLPLADVSGVAGAPINTYIPVALPAVLYGYYDPEYGLSYFDEAGALFSGLPTGVNAALVNRGTEEAPDPAIHVTGTMPATAAEVDVVLYTLWSDEDYGQPFISTLTFVPSTADTGASPQTPWILAGAALLVAAGGALLVARRSRA